jgi:hypothetical protein
MQSGEQPGFDFRFVAQLMPLGCPDVKSLLGKITGIGFSAGQAEGELVKRLVILPYNYFKIRARHTSAFKVRGMVCPFVPEKNKNISMEQTYYSRLLIGGTRTRLYGIEPAINPGVDHGTLAVRHSFGAGWAGDAANTKH